MEDIVSLFIPMVGFVCIAFIFKVVTDNRVRRRLAETHANEEMVRTMLEADERNQYESSLKWGLVILAIGVAFGLVDLFNLTPEDPSSFGLIIGSAGVGLLAHHFMRKPQK